MKWRGYGVRMFSRAMRHNLAQIATAVEGEARAHKPLEVVDLGCSTGRHAAMYIPETAEVTAVEFSAADGEAAAAKYGWRVIQGDLNARLPISDATFDVVTSNQVIEHLYDTDRFVSEAFRVLRPGGLAVVSTENMASWHNIGSLLLGWQAFSLTNVTAWHRGLGNPLANLRGSGSYEDGWYHLRIFSYRGLKELFELAGFQDVEIKGAGYYPLPTSLALRDSRHAAFITAVARKPLLTP